MSTLERQQVAREPTAGNGYNGFEPRIFLQPIAAPSILGLFGFAAATFIVAANLAGWYGNHTTSPLYLAPFAAVFGGVAQFMAGMWAYRARDGLATAMHGMWGSFWIAYGILNVLLATGAAIWWTNVVAHAYSCGATVTAASIPAWSTCRATATTPRFASVSSAS